LSELRIHCKFLQRRVYDRAGCKENCKDFTVSLTTFDVFNKTQMCVSVITEKHNASKDWNSVILMFLRSFIIYLVFGCACRVEQGEERGEQFRGRRITAGGAEKSQQYHKYFRQYCTFVSERPQVRKWGH